MVQSQIIISATNIEKSFGSVHALQGVSLNVEKGKVLGLLGPNGAGKTTLVRILTTLLDLDKGSAIISGIDLVENPAEIRTRIGLAGQYAAVDENLTGQENLELMGRLYHLPKSEVKDRAKKLLARFSLLDSASRPVKTYSGGMRRRLDLAASLVGEPEILFLDEPTTGLDPHGRAELWEVIEDLVKDGTTVLLTTQYLEEADYLADTIVMIDHGKVIAQGTSTELKATIGGGVLELSLVDRLKLPQAMSLIKNLGVGEPEVDQISGHITISVEQGSKNLIEAIRILDGAGLEIADIELRKPSLDEVFIKLTGKGASEYDQR
jgi:ABC-2 type transport system ATP-binding protein